MPQLTRREDNNPMAALPPSYMQRLTAIAKNEALKNLQNEVNINKALEQCSDKKPGRSIKNWKFSIQSVKMLDIEDIAKELSYKNPIALITLTPKNKALGPTYVVVLHTLILNKKSLPNSCSEYSSTTMFGHARNTLVYFSKKHEIFAVFKNAVKEIKQSSWKKSDSFKADVEVVIPTIHT